MYVLHNIHGQLSQYHIFIFSPNVDRDGASLISVGTKFHVEVHGKILSLGPFLLSFLILAIFRNALGHSLFCEHETYHQLVGDIDRFQTYNFLS